MGDRVVVLTSSDAQRSERALCELKDGLRSLIKLKGLLHRWVAPQLPWEHGRVFYDNGGICLHNPEQSRREVLHLVLHRVLFHTCRSEPSKAWLSHRKNLGTESYLDELKQ